MPNPWDVGSARLLAHLGFRGPGHHEQRLRRHASAGSTGRSPATRRWPTPRPSRRATDVPVERRPRERVRRRARGRWPPRSPAGHRRRGWPAARSRTTPGRPDEPIYERAACGRAGGGCRGGGARRTGAVRAHGSRREPTCTTGPTSPTRSSACRRSRRQGPTCSTPRACATRGQVATGGPRGRPARQRAAPARAARPWRSWPRPACAGSPWVVPSATSPRARWRPPARELLEEGTTGFMAQVVDGARVARRAYR